MALVGADPNDDKARAGALLVADGLRCLRISAAILEALTKAKKGGGGG
jgi:hypothetical protein